MFTELCHKEDSHSSNNCRFIYCIISLSLTSYGSIVFLQVEKAGVKIVSNISQLSNRGGHKRSTAVNPVESETEVQDEVQIRSHDAMSDDESAHRFLAIPTASKARKMMKVQSLPSALLTISNSDHDFKAQPVDIVVDRPQVDGKAEEHRNQSPVSDVSTLNAPQKTDSLNIVCSESILHIENQQELEKSTFHMTPLNRSSDESVGKGPSPQKSLSPDLPLSPPPVDPTLKQRRLSLLTNRSEMIAEDLSKQ